MAVQLFICLILLTTILAEDADDSRSKTITDHFAHYRSLHRRLITESSESSPDTIDNLKYDSENKSEYIRNDTNVTNGPTKNETDTIKPITEKEMIQTASSQIVDSFPPYTGYEVTENVVDIPDNRTPLGPIVPNFTLRPPPLNLANPNSNTNTANLTENNIKNKKNKISILHVNAEYDDKLNEVNDHKVTGIFKGIKEYLHNFHKGIVKGIHNFFHKHDDDHGIRFKRATRKVMGSVKGVDKTDYYMR